MSTTATSIEEVQESVYSWVCDDEELMPNALPSCVIAGENQVLGGLNIVEHHGQYQLWAEVYNQPARLLETYTDLDHALHQLQGEYASEVRYQCVQEYHKAINA